MPLRKKNLTDRFAPSMVSTVDERQRKSITKFLPISFFKRVSRFRGVQDSWRSNKENPSVHYTGMLPCLAPCWPQIIQICISFRSRSDLVLGTLTIPWTFSELTSFYRRVSRFEVFQTEIVHSCFCLVRIKVRCSCGHYMSFAGLPLLLLHVAVLAAMPWTHVVRPASTDSLGAPTRT